MRTLSIRAAFCALLLMATGAEAQTDVLYITDGATGTLFMVQGGALIGTAPIPSRAYPIAVHDTVWVAIAASLSSEEGPSREYDLTGAPTGNTAGSNTLAGVDGTTDRTYNFMIGRKDGQYLWRTDLRFSRPSNDSLDPSDTRAWIDLNDMDIPNGVAYDPTDRTFWIAGRYEVRHYSYGAALLGSFPHAFVSGGIAYEPSTDSLWLTIGTNEIRNYAKNGDYLGSVTIPGLRGTGAEFRMPPRACGDGLVTWPEPCEDGNTVDGDGCSSSCVVEYCGDGMVNNSGTEACDDGNADDTDLCRSDCTASPPRCGDGQVDPGEQCDDGNDSANDSCLNTCTIAACGDGATQTGVEECDDANFVETDHCLNDCTVASCGDGIVEDGLEACDDGNADDSDDCLSSCVAARCGDGVLRTGVEQCDDGNNSSGDCCSGACAYETGGDACTSDENSCTQDLCDDHGSCEHIARPQEPANCLAAPKAKLQILTSGPAEDHKLSWQWTAGDAFDQGALGSVGVSSQYALCVYDGSSTEYVERGSLQLATGGYWTSKDPDGALYKDRQGSFGGVSRLQIRTGADGKAKVKLRADGANLLVDSDVYTAAPDVIVQLVNSDGTCWTSSFAGDQIRTNEIGEFQAAVK